MNETNEANEMMLDSVTYGEISTFEEDEELAKEALDIEESVLEESDEEGEDIDETDELSRLRTELEELRTRLSEKEELEKASLRMRQELTEFGEYFPEVELESIPEEVWDKVKGGAGIQGNGREGAEGYRLPTLHLAFSTCFGFSFPRSRSSGQVWGHVAYLGGEPRKL